MVWDRLTRRELLRLGAATGASCVLGNAMTTAQTAVAAKNAIDHVLVGVPDLVKGIEWFQNLTGVRAAAGGSHPGVGTRNALAALGGRQYLELIAPDPAQATFNFRTDLRKLDGPRLIGWAAAAIDIEAVARKARDAGVLVLGPRDGSRARPDGKVLSWKTLTIAVDLGQNGIDPIPFFIEWAADSAHPSQDSPKGCELLTFELRHPNVTGIIDTLKKVGIDANVRPAESASLKLTLQTPKGQVEVN